MLCPRCDYSVDLQGSHHHLHTVLGNTDSARGRVIQNHQLKNSPTVHLRNFKFRISVHTLAEPDPVILGALHASQPGHPPTPEGAESVVLPRHRGSGMTGEGDVQIRAREIRK